VTAKPVARVICAGHVNWDVTLHVDRLPVADDEAVIDCQSQAAGGSAANTAAVLAGLEETVALLGSTGADEHGHAARDELTAIGVDCSPLIVDDVERTTVKYLVVDQTGEVFILGNEGANEGFAADDLAEESLAAAEHLHLTSQPPATASRLAQRARESGLGVSVDPGRRLGDRDYRGVIAAADLLFLSDSELEAAPESYLDAAGAVVVTRGPEGASYLEDGRSVDHAGYDIDCVDTAGAGDAFAGGFLAAWLDGADEQRALAVGNAGGGLASRGVSARTYLSWADVEALLEIGPRDDQADG
jgi:ribokinase